MRSTTSRDWLGARLPGREELRLVHAVGDELTLGWVRAEGHRLGKCLGLPRALLDDIEREPAAWQGLREQVGEGALVDFQRAMLVA